MPAYFIAQLDIKDREAFAKYEAAFMDVFAPTGGRILAVDESGDVLEGDWAGNRTVLIEFPDKETAQKWFQSDAYQAISKHRRAGSDGNIILVRGL